MRRLLVPILAVVAFVVLQAITIVNEGERGIMLRFNKVHRDSDQKVVVYEPGFTLKYHLSIV
ncbi:Modulator of FtsH protease HflC [Mannheimia haemolytica]|uniref:Modulator of FtsH protease HflC n=1 Tax=Mannheimia haemolytica TaxID=75985 RepID=A0A378N9A3_MANHA|nr:Modulator of FtsH protease HflC [Mannheimia haemolytica]